MAQSRSNVILITLVVLLSIVSVGLLIAYLNANNDDSEDSDFVAPRYPYPQPAPEFPPPSSLLNYDWEKNVRLPSDVLPKHYDLYLHPNLESGTFSGNVGIEVDNQNDQDHFRLHVKDLNISESRLYKDSKQGEQIDLMEAFEYKENEYFVLRPQGNLQAAKYYIYLEFSGSLTNGIVGFYKSVYTNYDGKEIPIATSKFQPTSARKAFPCFDEPSFKSTFTVTLIRPTDRYIALSNMPVSQEIQDTPVPGLTEVKFEKSVPMVTYLACFIVCDFEYEEKITKIHGTKFRVYATPTQKDRVRYALDIGANITDYFENYFDVPYPLPKQDMIAIPDFSSGAMEHWGLITYRETALLYDSRESSSSNKQRVATVVSHELAHQWFGNLVTLSWWDDLWLNEGFASYMEYKGVANYHKNWNMETHFLTGDLHGVMDLDATINSHPIVQPVEHPDQITEIFDQISYYKGASVLRMLENFMGNEEFRQGVSNFLKKFKYDNAVTNDLWIELTKVAKDNLNITRIMDTWTRQMGLPLITIKPSSDNVYKITQENYLLDDSQQSKIKTSPFNYSWDVPITWITNKDPENINQKWLLREDEHLEIVVPNDIEWIKFNVGQFGYYRVNYPIDHWLRFGEILKRNDNIFTIEDRSSLINDAFSLSESGHLDYSIPMNMIQYLHKEKDYVPWRSAINKLNKLQNLLENTDVYPLLKNYLLSLVEKQYNNLGWIDSGSHIEKLNRVNILNLACRNGHQGCLNEAGKLFTDWIDNFTYISPNLRSLVYKYGMQTKGDAKSWQIMLERFMNEKNAQEKKKILLGLAHINEATILKRFLNLAKNESIIRSQDYITALSNIAKNPVGQSMIWDFVRNEWSYLLNRFTSRSSYLGKLPKRISANFNSQTKLNELNEFIEKYPNGGAGTRARKQAVEKVQNNINWMKQNQNSIHQWLKKNPIISQ